MAQESKKVKKEELVEAYKRAYPKEKAFLVTSDGQVFLERNRSLATLHQRGLGNEEKVQIIKVK